ncbi:MAG TPA: glucose-6-phosphate isomerase family protein [Armatimonadota bacterium]|jgi:glucose-6-phosphate isomerase
MVDLSEQAGFPLWLDPPTLHIRLGEGFVFGKGLPDEQPDTRTLEGMRPVLLDHDAEAPDPVLYTMYRDVRRVEDGDRWERLGLRFDITVVRPGALGAEWVKTFGHYHPTPLDSHLPFPEVYGVLHGRARYLLQHAVDPQVPADRQPIDDVVWVDAEPGDKVVMLPGYGHVTINPGDEPLVMVDWVDRTFRSLYQPYLDARGGAYYALSGGEWERNPRQPQVPGLRPARPLPVPELGLLPGLPLYTAADEDPNRFLWLSIPDNYRERFPEALG